MGGQVVCDDESTPLCHCALGDVASEFDVSSVSAANGYTLRVQSPAIEAFIRSFDEDIENFDPCCDTRDDELQDALKSEFAEYPGLAELKSQEEEEYTTFEEAVDAGWERVEDYFWLSREAVNEEEFRGTFSKSTGGAWELFDLLEVTIEPLLKTSA